jgi:hypothetical protein
MSLYSFNARVAKLHEESKEDPIKYLRRLTPNELLNFMRRQDKSTFWPAYWWRIHKWTQLNGYGCSPDQTTLWARKVVLRWLASHRACSMRELGYRRHKPK